MTQKIFAIAVATMVLAVLAAALLSTWFSQRRRTEPQLEGQMIMASPMPLPNIPTTSHDYSGLPFEKQRPLPKIPTTSHDYSGLPFEKQRPLPNIPTTSHDYSGLPFGPQPGVPPSTRLEKQRFLVPVAGLRGTYVDDNGILGVPPGVQGARFPGDAIVVDPAGSIFSLEKYLGGGASGALYKALGLWGVPVSDTVLNSTDSVTWNDGCHSVGGHILYVLHARSPYLRGTYNPTLFQEDLTSLLKDIFVTCRFTFIYQEHDELSLLLPLFSSGMYGRAVLPGEYPKVFAAAYREAVFSLAPDGDISSYIGAREVRICCYGEQDAILAAMDSAAQEKGGVYLR